MGKMNQVFLGLYLTLAFTTASAAQRTIVLEGDQKHTQYAVRDLGPSTTIDASKALFTVANSKNAHPTIDFDCSKGSLVTNSYPVIVRSSPTVRFVGGLFDGEVPQTSDWRATYCNSAALGLQASEKAIVEGVRVRRAWDAVRFSRESGEFSLRSSWISDTRDDCVENDQLKGGSITDTLFDGCFMGVSVDPGAAGAADASSEVLTLNGVLMMMKRYVYRGGLTHGVPFKTSEVSPSLVIYNTVMAMGDPHMFGLARLEKAWSKVVDCRDNVILWTSDQPLPRRFPRAPSCFKVLQGEEATAFWERARQNWIDCHPEHRRFQDDTMSMPSRCDPLFYGKKVRS
jgi:hypothetical protein